MLDDPALEGVPVPSGVTWECEAHGEVKPSADREAEVAISGVWVASQSSRGGFEANGEAGKSDTDATMPLLRGGDPATVETGGGREGGGGGWWVGGWGGTQKGGGT